MMYCRVTKLRRSGCRIPTGEALGAAGPFLLLGDQAKSIVGGPTVLAIAIAWFILCQAAAHALIAVANAGETHHESE